MSDTEVESLNTVSPLTFGEIVANIKDSARECAESEDYISFATVLDIYLSDWNAYSTDECMQLMELIYTCLDENRDMLSEIAWDLPPLLLPFIDCDWPVSFALRDAAQINIIYKVFNLLAEFGEPKGFLLTCTDELKKLKDAEASIEVSSEQIQVARKRLSEELLSSTENPDDYIAIYLRNGPRRSVILKFNCLFQCIKFSFQRIKTIYPSKFLSLIVSAVLSYTNSAPGISGEIAVLRAMYLFIRDYNPPDVPEDVFEKESAEDLEKVFEDESYLQGKLMHLLFDNIVERFGKNHFNSLLLKILPSWGSNEGLEGSNDFYVLMDRLLTLALSMDINLQELFAIEAKQCSMIFDKNMHVINTSDDIIRLVVAYYNSTSFREKKPSKLPLSASSIITLYTYAKYSEHWNLEIPEADDALTLMKMQLMLYIPYVVDSKLVNMTTVSYYMLLTILSIDSKKRIAFPEQLEDKKVKLIIFTYLQNVASVVSNFFSATSVSLRMIKTLFSKLMRTVLQYLPEHMAYEYIIDTLENCPFEYSVSCVLHIYKNLISTSQYDEKKIILDLSKLSVSEEKSDEKSEISRSLPPPLPQRSSYSKPSFINFTKERQVKLLDLMNKCVDDTFKSSSDNSEIDLIKANRLLNYLNFLSSTKFKDMERVKILLNNITTLVKDADVNFGKNSDAHNISAVLDTISKSVDSVHKLYMN